jgi:hypothetical protein
LTKLESIKHQLHQKKQLFLNKDNPLISPERHKLFRSGVGMLLYLFKHSRPDISNAVRELSKVSEGATEAHWKELLRTIKFILATFKKALLLHPKMENEIFYMEETSDASLAEDKNGRLSLFGYTLFFVVHQLPQNQN